MELPLSTFTDLPEDIARLIFEVAVEDDACRPHYARISRQVQRWVEPLIYRDVVVDLARGWFHRTATALVSTKPPEFFAVHVKSLFFKVYDSSNQDRDAARILQKCHSVRSLAIWAYVFPGSLPRLQAVISSPTISPTTLSLSQFILSDDCTTNRTFSHPIFSKITHLDITCMQEEGEMDWSSLASLQELTHLSIDIYLPRGRDPIGLVEEVLQSCPTGLRVLVVWPCADFFPTAALKSVDSLARGDVDPRVVIVSMVGTRVEGQAANFTVTADELLNEWSCPSTGGSTLWARAEAILNERLIEKARKRHEDNDSSACPSDHPNSDKGTLSEPTSLP